MGRSKQNCSDDATGSSHHLWNQGREEERRVHPFCVEEETLTGGVYGGGSNM